MAALKSGCAILATISGVSAFVPQGLKTAVPHLPAPGFRQQEHTSPQCSRPMRMSLDDLSESRQDFLKDSGVGLVAGAIAVGASTEASPPAEAATVSAWEQIQLPVASVLYDIAFDPEHPDHGLIVGAQGTFLEASLRCFISSRSHNPARCSVLHWVSGISDSLTRVVSCKMLSSCDSILEQVPGASVAHVSLWSL